MVNVPDCFRYNGFEATLWRHIVWNAGYFGCIFQVRARLSAGTANGGAPEQQQPEGRKMVSWLHVHVLFSLPELGYPWVSYRKTLTCGHELPFQASLFEQNGTDYPIIITISNNHR